MSTVNLYKTKISAICLYPRLRSIFCFEPDLCFWVEKIIIKKQSFVNTDCCTIFPFLKNLLCLREASTEKKCTTGMNVIYDLTSDFGDEN